MAKFFEIVELSNGDIALRRVDEFDGDELVTIHFSDDAKASLQTHHFDVAQAMLEAGVYKVGELAGVGVEREESQTVGQQNQLH